MSSSPAASSSIDLLDANVLLRYLLGDHPDHSARAQALIESDRSFRVSVVTLIEVGYVLTRVAGVPRADAVAAMIDLLDRENLSVHEIDTDLAIDALRLCRPNGRVSFGDALLWAVARAGTACVWTFDERFPTQDLRVQQP